ncbi:MAG: hypothetical protein H0U85_00985 [Gemmatimonadales bacterium]|nr:hypothetical protein [Gemmatimonadales bacterium]
MKRLTALMLTCAALIGCGSDNGPGGTTLSTQERGALLGALEKAGLLETGAGAYANFVFAQLRSYGTVSLAGATPAAFSATGLQIKLVVTGAPADDNTFVASGLVGWTGLNIGTQTVDQAVSVGFFNHGAGADFPTSATASIGSGNGDGSFYIRATNSTYIATDGELTLTSASFGGSSSCRDVPTVPNIPYTCRVSTGTMQGSFSFNATRERGTGAATFSQPLTTFDVPAVRITLTADASSFAAVAAH